MKKKLGKNFYTTKKKEDLTGNVKNNSNNNNQKIRIRCITKKEFA